MERIIKFLERKDLNKGPTVYSSTPFKLPFELQSYDYIRFGKEDLKEKTPRAFVNALSNIKRAIDCRIESLLYLFGTYDLAYKENWSFPKKIDFLEKIGVVAPRILKKINKKRNQIEHDFKKPAKEEIEDFLDIENLFLLYTQKLLNNTYDDYFEWKLTDDYKFNSDWVRIKLHSKKSCFEIELIENTQNSKKIEINIKDADNYSRVLKEWVSSIINS